MVVSTPQPNDPSTHFVDLAHETLLRYDRNKKPYWETLRTEVTKRHKEIENRQLAEALAKEWRENGSPRWSGLATRAQRKAFRALRDLSDDATAYVKASQLLAKRLMWSVAIAVVLAVSIGSLVAWAKSRGTQAGMVAKFLLTRAGLDLLSPAMQGVSAGTFWMGDKDEKSAHEIRIVQSFAMGRYEVTFEEYDLFAAIMERELANDAGWGRGRRPVINVSWDDATAYAKWLSEATDKRYRLPTEAEWEYAARSGGREEVWAGTSEEKQLKDYAVYNTDHTEQVGGKKPNGIGLYDMSGNVDEWVEDCWHENYTGAPADGSPWLEAGGGDCRRRVTRGGSMLNFPVYLRVSLRDWFDPDGRVNLLGFRVVQDLP